MKKAILAIFFLFFWGFLETTFSQSEQTLINSLKKELSRFIENLKSQQYPPYYISYQVFDVESAGVTNSFGRTFSKGSSRFRFLDIDLRVGDYQLDNTHQTERGSFSFSSFQSSRLPLNGDEKSIRSAIWNATEKAYKEAAKQYQNVLSSKALKVKEEDTSADFSREEPSIYFEPRAQYKVDLNKWEAIFNRVSKIFRENKWLLEGRISFSYNNYYEIFVNSEGSEIAQNDPRFWISIYVRTKADDGMVLYLYKNFFGFSESELPSEDSLKNALTEIIQKLKKLRDAPLAETYSGPAILKGEASGVFFHEIFGHRVEGHRQKDPRSAQTFKSYLNKKILPEFMNVVFDPTIKEINGFKLSGYYKYDDEGVKAQRVVSVDSGVFKNFIMSRSPIEKFPKSNGHGRKNYGYRAVARQSNLIVESTKKVPFSTLRKMMIDECKKQGLEYGLIFETVEGGFTFTGRTIPNAFNVLPIVVYKVYVDGRPDEMVRGVDLIGTPLTTFSNITATADDLGVFNGTCGAESGGVPVAAVSPSILVSKIEVQKKEKSEEKPPILPSP
ncbi:MAG: TldD/PmbA family protein [Ignavibacteria bacterium]|nr:TldD/PmbA family protein [Ignavibacteria bacterium]